VGYDHGYQTSTIIHVWQWLTGSFPHCLTRHSATSRDMISTMCFTNLDGSSIALRSRQCHETTASTSYSSFTLQLTIYCEIYPLLTLASSTAFRDAHGGFIEHEHFLTTLGPYPSDQCYSINISPASSSYRCCLRCFSSHDITQSAPSCYHGPSMIVCWCWLWYAQALNKKAAMLTVRG
jgi:hypothetical protein